MSDHQLGESRRSRGDKTRQAGRRLIGAVLVAGVTPLAAAPAAHADFDDVFQPLISAVEQSFSVTDPAVGVDDVAGAALATGTDPLASLDALLSSWYQSLITDPVNNLEQWLFGGLTEPGAAADPGAALGELTSATVPLAVKLDTEPVVTISVGGGASTPVLIDTGSSGLVIPIWDINPFGITGLPTGMGIGAYSGGMDYVYLTLPTTVSFGNDIATGTPIVTGDTAVNAVLFAFPTVLGGPWTINQFLAGSADGILGVGPDSVGPTPDYIPTEALPGALGHGLMLDQQHHVLYFGDNPLSGGTTVNGVANATLDVSVDGGPVTAVKTIIDSGGVYGTMPQSALGGLDSLPAGTHITVYPHNGTVPLYSYTTGSGVQSPTVVSGTSSMNTGNWPFQQLPIYISYADGGHTTFGGSYNVINP